MVERPNGEMEKYYEFLLEKVLRKLGTIFQFVPKRAKMKAVDTWLNYLFKELKRVR